MKNLLTSALVLASTLTHLVNVAAQNYALIDAKATAETKALHQNLKDLSRNHILFGHQHATEYGHGWYGDVLTSSDVKSACVARTPQ